MGRRTVILIAAFLIAGLGASLVFLYVQGVDQRAQAEAEPVQVMTVTEPIAAGESVVEAEKAGKFALTEVAGTSVLDNALSDTTTIADQVAVTPLYKGEQVVAAKFGQIGSQSRISIPGKAIAVSVQLSDPQRVAGFVSPGSQVAVFSTVGASCETKNVNIAQPFTGLLLEDAPVVGVGQTGLSSTTTVSENGEQTTEEVPTTVLTLGLDQADAEKLILASQASCLSVGLRTDKSVVGPSPGVAFADLFGEG
ncbi:MAG: Flp pilus assembly protein CpaB [Actinomycetota bacterium]|nr:Flp pilus assembly protein CpaB [Actinomycetota bacterium]